MPPISKWGIFANAGKARSTKHVLRGCFSLPLVLPFSACTFVQRPLMLSVPIYTTADLLLSAQLKHTKTIQTKIPQEIYVNIICLFSFSVSDGDKIIASIF